MKRLTTKTSRLRWAAALLAVASLNACAPLVIGSAVGGAFMASDRRTSGTQLEDKGIEFKAASRIRDTIGDEGHVNVNAYNRKVLLTGEVPNENARAAAGQAAASTENVTEVFNELAVSLTSSIAGRSNDVLLEGKVRASLIDARDLFANAYTVVVERGDVYLMGLVTQREADRAAELAASISGVKRVIKVMQIISEDELAGKLPRPPANAASSGS
jgi:osmotically-inducible protein OsmY